LRMVGPAVAAVDDKVKIMVYDHNWDITGYAIDVLSSDAGKYAAGTAWHCYGGEVSAQSVVHDKFPDKETFFTECAQTKEDNFEGDMKWAVENLWMGSTNHWSSTVTHWNLILDQTYGPHKGGCDTCRGTCRIDTSNNNEIIFFSTIVGLGHYGKWINPDVGATRVKVSTKGDDCVSATSWKNNDQDGQLMIMVNNFCGEEQEVEIQRGNQYVTADVGNGISTFLWGQINVIQ